MDLKDTADMMNSADYRERFKAEYKQLTIRLLKLAKLLEDYSNGELDIKLACPYEVLKIQHDAMLKYKLCLELRAEYEGIKI